MLACEYDNKNGFHNPHKNLRLFIEAGMGNFTQIERLKNSIKEEVENYKTSYKEKEKA